MAALQPHTVGFINWPLCDMPEANDISNYGGIFTHDCQRKALTAVYEDFARDNAGKPSIAHQRR